MRIRLTGTRAETTAAVALLRNGRAGSLGRVYVDVGPPRAGGSPGCAETGHAGGEVPG